jgi:hypothetical protein
MADERPPLDRGDFVWTHFPSSEHPTEPSGLRHIALCLRSASHANGSLAALPLTVDYFPDLEKPDHG